MPTFKKTLNQVTFYDLIRILKTIAPYNVGMLCQKSLYGLMELSCKMQPRNHNSFFLLIKLLITLSNLIILGDHMISFLLSNCLTSCHFNWWIWKILKILCILSMLDALNLKLFKCHILCNSHSITSFSDFVFIASSFYFFLCN